MFTPTLMKPSTCKRCNPISSHEGYQFLRLGIFPKNLKNTSCENPE